MLEKQVKYSRTGYFLLLTLLFLCAMNFKTKFFYFVFIATALAIILFRGRRLSIASFLYLGLSVVMAIYHLNDGVLAVLKLFSYPMMYYVGYVLSVNLQEKGCTLDYRCKISQERLYQILFAIALGSFAHFMLNYFYNFGQSLGRNTNDIWTGSMQSATGQAVVACLMIGLSASLILAPRKKYSTLFGIVAIIGILMYNLVLACRTPLMLLLVALILGFCYIYKNTKQFSKKMKLIAGIFLIVSALFIVWNFDIGGIRTAFEESNLYSRFFAQDGDDIYDASRSSRKSLYLRDMLNHPWGGLNMRGKYGFAHDLLLDAYDEYGVLSLIFLIAILINGLNSMLSFSKNKNVALYVRTAYLCVYIVILAVFFTEPIFAGMPWLFVCYCLLNGALAGYNELNRKRNKEERLLS